MELKNTCITSYSYPYLDLSAYLQLEIYTVTASPHFPCPGAPDLHHSALFPWIQLEKKNSMCKRYHVIFHINYAYVIYSIHIIYVCAYVYNELNVQEKRLVYADIPGTPATPRPCLPTLLPVPQWFSIKCQSYAGNRVQDLWVFLLQPWLGLCTQTPHLCTLFQESAGVSLPPPCLSPPSRVPLRPSNPGYPVTIASSRCI